MKAKQPIMKTGIERIMAERTRQITSEGWTLERDALKEALKEFAETIKWLDQNTNTCYPMEQNKRVSKALAHPLIKEALKD